MRAILMSTQSKWLFEIFDGKKTVELRKRFPKDYRGWVYLYCTKAKPYLNKSDNSFDGCCNGKVVARVWVDDVGIIPYDDIADAGLLPLQSSLCLSSKEIMEYANNSPSLTVICFSKLEIFDKPKELSEFYYYKKRLIDCGMDCPPYVDEVKTQVRKAPPSWQYVEVEQ